MEDGEEKLAAFFRQARTPKPRPRMQDASGLSRRGRIPWKLLLSVLVLLAVVWSFRP